MTKIIKTRTLKLSFVLLLALVLSACGFQPRGQQASISHVASPIYIVGLTKFSPLHRELSHQLTRAGATMAADLSSAVSVLRINTRHNSDRLLSVDSRNKGVEYELEESLKFTLRNSQGELVPEQEVRVLRILFRPQQQILGSDREEDLLRADMYKDISSRIIKRIAAQR